MKAICNTHALLSALRRAAGVINPHTHLPALQSVEMRADFVTGLITISASRLTQGIRITLPAEVEEPGRFTVRPDLLAPYLKTLPQGQDLLLATLGTELTVTQPGVGESPEAAFGVLPDGEFPAWPSVRGQFAMRVPDSAAFRKALLRVAVCACEDIKTTPNYCGVRFALTHEGLGLRATDRVRFAWADLAAEYSGLDFGFLAPLESLRDLIQRLPYAPGEPLMICPVKSYADFALFAIGDTEYCTDITTEHFPDHKLLIPRQSATTLHVNRAELVRALAQAALFEDGTATRLQAGDPFSRLLTQNSPARIVLRQQILATRYGAEGEIGINPGLLLGAIRSIPAAMLTLRFTDAKAPLLVEGDGVQALVMPMYVPK